MSDGQAEFPLTLVFRPEAVFCAFPVGQWERVGPADSRGRTAIRVKFRSRGELALALLCSGYREADVVAEAYAAWEGAEWQPTLL